MAQCPGSKYISNPSRVWYVPIEMELEDCTFCEASIMNYDRFINPDRIYKKYNNLKKCKCHYIKLFDLKKKQYVETIFNVQVENPLVKRLFKKDTLTGAYTIPVYAEYEVSITITGKYYCTFTTGSDNIGKKIYYSPNTTIKLEREKFILPENHNHIVVKIICQQYERYSNRYKLKNNKNNKIVERAKQSHLWLPSVEILDKKLSKSEDVMVPVGEPIFIFVKLVSLQSYKEQCRLEKTLKLQNMQEQRETLLKEQNACKIKYDELDHIYVNNLREIERNMDTPYKDPGQDEHLNFLVTYNEDIHKQILSLRRKHKEYQEKLWSLDQQILQV